MQISEIHRITQQISWQQTFSQLLLTKARKQDIAELSLSNEVEILLHKSYIKATPKINTHKVQAKRKALNEINTSRH